MAARAGAVISDPEFVQFHPTALNVGRDPAPLATEALRGEGATLIDETGRRFMTSVHPSAELAPRDVVARGIHRADRARPSRVSRLPRGHRREIPGTFPDGLCRLPRGGHRSRDAKPSRWRPPRTITWAASPRTCAAALRSKACGRSANAPRQVCTAPTGSHPIRCSKRSSSAPRRRKTFAGPCRNRTRQRHAARACPLHGHRAAADAARCHDTPCRPRTRSRGNGEGARRHRGGRARGERRAFASQHGGVGQARDGRRTRAPRKPRRPFPQRLSADGCKSCADVHDAVRCERDCGERRRSCRPRLCGKRKNEPRPALHASAAQSSDRADRPACAGRGFRPRRRYHQRTDHRGNRARDREARGPQGGNDRGFDRSRNRVPTGRSFARPSLTKNPTARPLPPARPWP